MIPIWLALLLSWALWAIILFICDNFHFGISFQNDVALYLFCAPVVIPIFVIGFPIAFCIRWYRKLKWFFETKRRKKN